MKNNKTTLSILALALISSLPTQAAVVLASWQFNGSTAEGAGPVAATNTDVAVTSAVMTRGSGLGTPSVRSGTWESNGAAETSAESAKTGNDFFEVVLTPQSGQTLSITSVDTILAPRGAGTMVMTAYTFNGSTYSSAYSNGASGNDSEGAFNLAYSMASELQNFSSAVTLRFTVHRTGAADGNVYIGTQSNTNDLDFVINGEVVPEPSTALLSGLAALTLLRRKRS